MRVSKRPEGRMYLMLLAQVEKRDFLGTGDPRPSVLFGCLCLQEETV